MNCLQTHFTEAQDLLPLLARTKNMSMHLDV